MSPTWVCPRTRGPLRDWYSPDAHLRYPLLDGIPVLVPDPVALLGRSPVRRVETADATRVGLPDPITPHLPPSLFAAPGAFGQWLTSLGDLCPDSVCVALSGRHAPAGAALDVGCGVGSMARRMVAAGRPTWAFDLSLDAVLLARGLLCGGLAQTTFPTHRGGFRRVKVPFKAITSGLAFAVADAAAPPLPDDSFAWVHLGDVLDGLGDVAEVLVACAGLLVRGGVLTLTTAYGSVGGLSEAAPPADEELLEALEALGLDVVEQQDRIPAVERRYDRSYAVRFMHCVAARRR